MTRHSWDRSEGNGVTRSNIWLLTLNLRRFRTSPDLPVQRSLVIYDTFPSKSSEVHQLVRNRFVCEEWEKYLRLISQLRVCRGAAFVNSVALWKLVSFCLATQPPRCCCSGPQRFSLREKQPIAFCQGRILLFCTLRIFIVGQTE